MGRPQTPVELRAPRELSGCRRGYAWSVPLCGVQLFGLIRLLGVGELDRPQAIRPDVEEVDAILGDIDRRRDGVRRTLHGLLRFAREVGSYRSTIRIEQRDRQLSFER